MTSERAQFDALNHRIVDCEKCDRLRSHCLAVAARKRASYLDQTYFGKPVPNFGDPFARLLIVGLAPAAHGANRTGRMFTGDRSGDWLFRALHEAGFANQPTATGPDDGLRLTNALITAAAHCAPPGNKPTTEELANCSPYLEQTFDLLPQLCVVVCLGHLALNRMLKLYRQRSWVKTMSQCPFAHGRRFNFHPTTPATRPPPAIICSYHPSQQNTFTGRLTHDMLLDVFRQASALANAGSAVPPGSSIG